MTLYHAVRTNYKSDDLSNENWREISWVEALGIVFSYDKSTFYQTLRYIKRSPHEIHDTKGGQLFQYEPKFDGYRGCVLACPVDQYNENDLSNWEELPWEYIENLPFNRKIFFKGAIDNYVDFFEADPGRIVDDAVEGYLLRYEP